MQSIVDNSPKEALDQAGVRLVVIGCGSPAMAKAYKGTFLPFTLSPICCSFFPPSIYR